jgi:hypothetical protein
MSQPPSRAQHELSPDAGQLGWRGALLVALAVLIVYIGTTRLTGRTTTPQVAYFDRLAAAFLDGRLYLEDPPGDSDLTLHDGRWYVPFPPLAAVLMLPWVAAFGVEGTNTVVFSIIFGTINVVVLARIFDALARRGWIELGVGGRYWLLALFAFGCVHWQVALAVWAAITTRSPWLAGVALAVALWGRPNVIFTWPLLLGIAAQQLRDAAGHIDRPRLITWAWCSTAPLAVSIAGLMTYNYARFHDPFDFGYATQNVSAAVRGDLARGQFHVYHLPRNLHTMLMGPPEWYEPEHLPHWRLPKPNPWGMSIFLTTPALFYVIRARGRRDPFVRGAWLATGLLLIPLLLYYNTGWMQFGYRFSLDFMIPLMVLLAVAAGRRTTWPMRTLILLGVLINAWGVVWWYTNWLD